MKKKKYKHSCELNSLASGKKRFIGKKVSPLHKSVDKKTLTDIYSRYYKNQLAALYRATQS